MNLRLVTLLLVFALGLAGCQSVPTEADNAPAPENKEASDYNIQAGLGYLQQRQYQRALSKFDKALQQQPDSIDAAMGQAAAMQSLGRQLQAESVYVRLIKQNPGRYEPASAYAGMLCEQQRFQQAEAVILEALKQRAFEQGADAYLRLGRCAVRGKRFDLAELYFNRAQELSAGSSKSVRNEVSLQRAWLAYQDKQYAKAQKLLEHFESGSPLRSDAVRLGYLIAKGQNNQQRMATYGQILRQNYPQIWSQLETASSQ